MNENTNAQSLETLCYSFEVKMNVQILANNEDHAFSMLDSNGGYVSKREVTLVKTVLIDDEKK
jgi:hypothetical protein